jgi:hypothetical protein
MRNHWRLGGYEPTAQLRITEAQDGQVGHPGGGARVRNPGGVTTHGFPCGVSGFWNRILVDSRRRGRRSGILAGSNSCMEIKMKEENRMRLLKEVSLLRKS